VICSEEALLDHDRALRFSARLLPSTLFEAQSADVIREPALEDRLAAHAGDDGGGQACPSLRRGPIVKTVGVD